MRYIQGMAIGGVTLATPSESDAGDIIELMKTCYGETEFLSRDPDEFQITLDGEIQFLRGCERDPKSCMICAYVEGRIVGSMQIGPVQDVRRARHRADLGICVRQSHWGQGIGGRLMDAALQTASSLGYRQVELRADADNLRAIHLYERFGFAVCGRIPGALRHGSRFSDEIIMVHPLI